MSVLNKKLIDYSLLVKATGVDGIAIVSTIPGSEDILEAAKRLTAAYPEC